MLVAFTVVAVWLGWNMGKVHQRNAVLASIAGKHSILQLPDYVANWDIPDDGEKAALYTQEVEADRAGLGPYKAYTASAPYGVSKVRQWLGDKPLWLIAYTPGPDVDSMRSLFPEATILVPAKLQHRPARHRAP